MKKVNKERESNLVIPFWEQLCPTHWQQPSMNQRYLAEPIARQLISHLSRAMHWFLKPV